MTTIFYSQYGRNYVVGKLVIKMNDGGDRVTLQHCDTDMLIFYPNDDFDGLPIKALCDVCHKPFYAKWVGDLWETIQTL